MKLYRVWICALIVSCIAGVSGARAEDVVGGKECPQLVHQAISTAIRGVPVELFATVTCPEGSVDEVLLQIRVTDAGKPKSFKMKPGRDGSYSATVPLPLIKGLARFWYYIDARGKNADGEPVVAQTIWHVVTITDPANLSQGGAGGAEPQRVPFYWFAGGAAAVGAGFAISHENRGHSDASAQKNDSSQSQASTRHDNAQHSSRSKSSQNSSGGGGGGGGCVTTGSETIGLSFSSPCVGQEEIVIAISGFCPGANFTVSSTWGESASLANAAGPTATLNLLKPMPPGPPHPPANSETVTIRENGVVIHSFGWPIPAELALCP